MERKYDVLTTQEIDSGRATDAYFLRTEEILEHEDEDPEVVAEVGETVDRPHVFAGLKDVARMLEGRDVDLYALPEGATFRNAPVLRLEGRYTEFGRYETSILGFTCKASAVATAAATIDAAAGNATVASFGTRREHPSTAAMVERSAHIGGADLVSHVAGAEAVGLEAGGTMPHALVISLRSQERAWKAFDEALSDDVPRIMLCDTYEDEKKESVAAAGALGDAIDGVRLDTTGSRRGDMREICEEVRWELDVRGFEDVDVFVSGGIGVEEVLELRNVVDGFGVGGSIASVPPVDLSLDVVEVEGELAAKRGETSGAKDVVRDEDGVDRPVPASEDIDTEYVQVLDSGEIVHDFDLEDARERAESFSHQFEEYVEELEV